MWSLAIYDPVCGAEMKPSLSAPQNKNMNSDIMFLGITTRIITQKKTSLFETIRRMAD